VQHILWVFEKCVVLYSHHYIIKQNFTVPKSLCSAYSSCPPPNSWQPLMFLLSIVLAFPKCHAIGIIDVAFCWLLLLSNIHIGFLHIFLWLHIFLLVNDTPLYGFTMVWIHSIVWIHYGMDHSSTGGHVDFF
jgi:hypothetical protein